MLKPYFRAGYPALAVETAEERRLVKESLAEFDDTEVLGISSQGGLIDLRRRVPKDPAANYAKAFAYASSYVCVVFVFDWQHVCRSPGGYRPFLMAVDAIKKRGSMVVFVAPHWELPAELAHEMPVLEHRLPDREGLKAAIRTVAKALKKDIPDDAALLDAASGLTLSEAENAAALSAVQSGCLDAATIEAEKIRIVRQQSGLEISPPTSLGEVGGLSNLKRWVDEEVLPSRRDPQLAVRAALLVGQPGTGKSLAARAIGGAMGIPVIRLDLAACRGQYVGQTEGAVRAALRTADAVAPCVLWVDEIDSGLGGHASSAQTDGGVTLGVLSILLTWMQEHQSPVLLLATANYPDRIPPALLRPGRMDRVWAVDLPTIPERQEIAAIHLRRLGCDDSLADHVASLTEGYSGAEIAGAILSAARRTRRRIDEPAIEQAVSAIVPLSRSRAGELEKMREWARAYALPANTTEDSPANNGERYIRLDLED